MRWIRSNRADAEVVPLADRHYNRQKIGSPQFAPPGRCLVLKTAELDAFWITSWPFAEYVRHAWAGAWVCSAFRNESAHLSSELIREAVAATVDKYGPAPPLGMITFVDTKKTRRKRDPGRCYLRAGFKNCGMTKGGLIALQLLPEDMPKPMRPLDDLTQHRKNVKVNIHTSSTTEGQTMSQKKLFLTVSMALSAAAHIFKQAGESTVSDALDEPTASPPPPPAGTAPKGRPGRKPAAAAAAVVDTSLDDPAAGGVDALDDLGDPASCALDDLDGLGDPAPLKATLKPAVTYTVADVRKKLLELKAKDGDDTTRANKIIRAAVPADLPSSVPNIPAEKYLAVIAQIDKLLKV